MKTTLNLDAELLQQARARAAERSTTLTKVIEDALRADLTARPRQEVYSLNFPTVAGTRPAALDVADRDALHDVMAEPE